MKKVGVILVFAFVTALIVSSCNKEACPAYTSAETEQTNQPG